MSEEDSTTELAPEVIERAERMGWSPKDQFRGDPDKWVDADVFLERGENNLGILKERSQKLEGTVANLEKQLRRQNETFAEFVERSRKVEERAYERALAELKAEQRKARADGDADAVAEIGEQITKTEVERVEAAKAAKAKADAGEEGSVELDPATQAFIDSNAVWWRRDPVATQMAVTMHEANAARGMSIEASLKEVQAEIQKRFPEHFKNPRRDAAGLTQGAGDVSGAAGASVPESQRTYANLPADAKAQCDRFVKEIPGFKREDYVKDYEWE